MSAPTVPEVKVPLDAEIDDQDQDPNGHRHVLLTPASAIEMRRVSWIWADRIALGTLALIAGPEGLGKSTLAIWLAARVTRGDLPGEDFGRPRSVLICAAEDSWEHTIVPRLLAAGADLDRVFRVEVQTADEVTVGLSLPRDLIKLEDAALGEDAALLILDPLTSRLSEGLDTHKDSDVRRALEPLVAIADRAHLAIIGLIHHNKSGSTDPLQLVMASKAFTAVARSVHTAIRDPEDDTGQRRLFGTPKNNLGRGDLPTLGFTIVGHAIDTSEGVNWTGRLDWLGEVEGTIADAMQRSTGDPDERSAIKDAGDWLVDYLTANGSTAKSADVKKHGHAAGHSARTLARARKRVKATTETVGFPAITYWSLPGSQPETLPDPQLCQPALGRVGSGTTGISRGQESRSGTVVPVAPTNGDGAPVGTTEPAEPDKPGLDWNQRFRQFNDLAALPGRCRECAFHIGTQGHRDSCSQAVAS